MPVKTPDENYKKYATPSQWEAYVAVCKLGGLRQAATKLNITRPSLRDRLAGMYRKAAQQGYAPPTMTHHVPDGLRLKGTSQLLNGSGELEAEWVKTAIAGREDSEVVHVADPKTITKVSTFYDQQGKVGGQWVSERPEEKAKEALWRLFAEELCKSVERAKPELLGKIKTNPNDDLLACYPVGDHHLGMLAWDEETGSDSYDLNIGERMLREASTYLMQMAPPCKQALVAFLGDFMHYDSFDAVTPTSRNILDADGRYPKMVRTAIRSMRHMITAALERHDRVRVIVEIGNHDLSSSIFLMELLAAVYENEPRVEIDTSPSHYHYFEFGTTLIGTHHGHGQKLELLPNIMAHDRSEAWGRSRHRYWWTGHIHQRRAFDVVGCSVESFRILPPTDAWAAQKGYRPIRDMKAIVIHKDHGEVARHTVKPEMFRS